MTPAKIKEGNEFPKLITIPTTAGTGAETETTAMITHIEKGMKLCIMHPDLKPSLTILDPELTVGLPANLTAWTGADAMIHSIEGYCVPGFHPLCDGAALESLSLISKSLYLAVEEPDNLAARGAMLVASCLGGISFIKGLGEIGVPEDCAERIAKKSMVDTAFGTNPRNASYDEMLELVKTSIKKAR